MVNTQCSCKAQVLLVDDTEFNLEILAGMLECMNIQVDYAFNGEEAVQMYVDNLQKECCNLYYRIIFMDIEMPVMNGYKASLTIKTVYESY